MGRYKVTGVAPVVGVDGVSVAAPGVVELDEDVTNVDALVISGCVARPKQKSGAAPVDAEAPPPADAKAEGS